MKKLVTLGLIVVAAQMTQAYPKGDKPSFADREPPSVEKRVDRMTEFLSLSETQASQVSGIMNSYEPQRKALKQQLQELHQQERQQIDALLTDEQKEKLASRRERWMKHH